MTDAINLEQIWASTGSATAPSDVDYKQGWLSEIPTFEEFNFILKGLDSNLLHLAESSTFLYQADITYAAGGKAIQANVEYTCVVDATLNVTPGTDNTRWVRGTAYGVARSTLLNQEGLLLSTMGGFTSTTLWEGSDITIRSAIPTIALESTGAGKNWLLANVGGELVAVDVASQSVADDRSIALAAANTHRLFHEDHPPIQSEVAGTIPDAPNNSTGYVRKGAAWVAESTGLGEAPTDGNQYVRKDSAWSQVNADGVPVGTIVASPLSIATMATNNYSPCSSATINRTTSAALFALIGSSYGDGDGSTTFNPPVIPNLLDATFSGLGQPAVRTTTAVGDMDVMALNDSNGDLYVADGVGNNDLKKLEGGSSTWANIGNLETSGFGSENPKHMAIDGNTGWIYIVKYTPDEIWRSTDGGVTFTVFHTTIYRVTGIYVDSRNSDVWITLGISGGDGRDQPEVSYGGNGTFNVVGDFAGGESVAIARNETSGFIWGSDDNNLLYLPGSDLSVNVVWSVVPNCPATLITSMAIDDLNKHVFVLNYVVAGTSTIYYWDVVANSWTTYYTSTNLMKSIVFNNNTKELQFMEYISSTWTVMRAVSSNAANAISYFIKDK